MLERFRVAAPTGDPFGFSSQRVLLLLGRVFGKHFPCWLSPNLFRGIDGRSPMNAAPFLRWRQG
jgi:hypothetical protein